MTSSYDFWKLRSDMDDPSHRNREPDTYDDEPNVYDEPPGPPMQCDVCERMTRFGRSVYVSYAGDTFACPRCLGDNDD